MKVHVDQYKYSGYGIGFDRKGFYSVGKKKDILIVGKGPTQALEHTLT